MQPLWGLRLHRVRSGHRRQIALRALPRRRGGAGHARRARLSPARVDVLPGRRRASDLLRSPLAGRSAPGRGAQVAWAIIGALAVAASAATIVTGLGIGRLERRALVPALILASLMLLAFPLGTIAGGEALYTLLPHESVLKQEADAVRAVPHAGKERIPLWQLLVIASLVLAIVAFFALAR